jgi:hypothetical protein
MDKTRLQVTVLASISLGFLFQRHLYEYVIGRYKRFLQRLAESLEKLNHTIR